MTRRFFLFVIFALVLAACSPAATAAPTVAPTAAATDTIMPTDTIVAPTDTPAVATDTPTIVADTPTVAATDTVGPSATPTLDASAAPTLAPTADKTETIGEQLKSHIVFFLLLVPGGKTGNKRTDACGNLKPEPIISKRLRTGDKIEDVQIALNMLFSVGVKYYGAYYNAMWNTQFTIDNYQYIAKDDYMIIQFGGFFPYSQLSACDKHGIREQIWSTFFYYGFREKTFKVADGFLIDRLGGD